MDQCPSCKSKNIRQFLTFKQCLNCGKTFEVIELGGGLK